MTKTPKTKGTKTPQPEPPKPKAGGRKKTAPASAKDAAGPAHTRGRGKPKKAAAKKPRNVIKAAVAAIFFEELRAARSVETALKKSGIPRSTAYAVKARDKEFSDEWQRSYDAGTDLLEEEATRRAFVGHKRPLFMKVGSFDEKGKRLSERIEKAGEETIFSDRLMEIMLRARRPQIYRERFEHTHAGKKGGEPIAFRNVSVKDLTNEQLAELEARLLAGDGQQAASATASGAGRKDQGGA